MTQEKAPKTAAEVFDQLPGIRKLQRILWEREKSILLPRGVITFPWDLRRGIEVDWGEVKRVRERFNLSDLFIVHGIALEYDGSGFVVTGPKRIGKSTLLRRLEKAGVNPIEDSKVIIGKEDEDGGVVLLETGFLPLAQRYGKLMSILRKGVGLRKTYHDAESTQRKRQGMDIVVSNLAGAIGNLTARSRRNEGFTPKVLPLAGLVRLEHQDDHLPIKVGDDSAEYVSQQEFLDCIKSRSKIKMISLPDSEAMKKAESALRSWMGA